MFWITSLRPGQRPPQVTIAAVTARGSQSAGRAPRERCTQSLDPESTSSWRKGADASPPSGTGDATTLSNDDHECTTPPQAGARTDSAPRPRSARPGRNWHTAALLGIEKPAVARRACRQSAQPLLYDNSCVRKRSQAHTVPQGKASCSTKAFHVTTVSPGKGTSCT